jgi:hypothetical protein
VLPGGRLDLLCSSAFEVRFVGQIALIFDILCLRDWRGRCKQTDKRHER